VRVLLGLKVLHITSAVSYWPYNTRVRYMYVLLKLHIRAMSCDGLLSNDLTKR